MCELKFEVMCVLVLKERKVLLKMFSSWPLNTFRLLAGRRKVVTSYLGTPERLK